MFRAPRGTSDILPDRQGLWRVFEATAQRTMSRFGYGRIDTPLFEDARLFARGIGEVTDIVEKETYTFKDRGGDLLTLRPEGTASVCRAYLEHGMHNLPQPVRLFYLCHLFRYERPQAGRYRQHHQLGIEVLGDGHASVDAEIIEVAWTFLEDLGLSGLSLKLNSIGDPECRPDYIARLVDHYRAQDQNLCQDCQRRLDANPLRLLDCKQETCRPVIVTAPHSIDYLCTPCADHWADLLRHIEAVGLSYTIDNTLVRGFDYYTRTVFEIVPAEGGSQSTLVGGGRYDGLVQELGGKPTPGVGFGMGIERALENLTGQGTPEDGKAAPKVLVACLGEAARLEGARLASKLRRGGIPAILGPSGRGLRSQLRYASSGGATHAVIIGDDELAKGTVVLRDMTKSEQLEVAPEAVAEAITGS